MQERLGMLFIGSSRRRRSVRSRQQQHRHRLFDVVNLEVSLRHEALHTG